MEGGGGRGWEGVNRGGWWRWEVAGSLTSARVGTGLVIMLSIICVAQMQNLLATLAWVGVG